MTAYGWAKPPSGRVRHYYETGGTRPLCRKNLPHVIGGRDPEASKRPHVDCASCVHRLRRIEAGWERFWGNKSDD